MLRTALLSALVLLAGLPGVASAATAQVSGGVLAIQLAAPGSGSVELEAPPCRETVHTSLDADTSQVRDPAGCAEIRTEVEDLAPGPGCAYASGAFTPLTQIVVCGLSGVGEVVLHGTGGPDRLELSAQRAHAQVLRLHAGAGDDTASLSGGLPSGAPQGGPVPTGAMVLDGGEGDDTLSSKSPAKGAVVCGGGNDTVASSDEHHDVGPDCEHWKGDKPTVRPASLPGRVGMEGGTLVVDATRYTGSSALGLDVDYGTFRGRTGWSIAETARSDRFDDEVQPRAIALSTGAGCEAYVLETGSQRHFCPAGPATPFTIKGPRARQLVTDIGGSYDSGGTPDVEAPVTVIGGRDDDYVAYGHPFRMRVSCGAGLDTVLSGTTDSILDARPALGVNAWSEGDCEIPRGVKRLGRPAPVKVRTAARGVVGDRKAFPLTGAGAVVTVTCPRGRLSCGGKLDVHRAGTGCGYLGTSPWTADRGRTVKVKVQFGTIEGALRCGSLLAPRSAVAAALRRRAPVKVRVVTRLGRSVKRWTVTLRR